MGTLERAIEIAARAHAEQHDPSGEPYILHPLRMMLKLNAPDDRIVAVLHDVIEKGDDWSIERLVSKVLAAKFLSDATGDGLGGVWHVVKE